MIPLIGQSYIFTGVDSDAHKNGKTYRVVETGEHWDKRLGFVVWMTTEEYEGTDIDFCCSCSIEYFNGNFWN